MSLNLHSEAYKPLNITFQNAFINCGDECLLLTIPGFNFWAKFPISFTQKYETC